MGAGRSGPRTDASRTHTPHALRTPQEIGLTAFKRRPVVSSVPPGAPGDLTSNQKKFAYKFSAHSEFKDQARTSTLVQSDQPITGADLREVVHDGDGCGRGSFFEKGS